MQWERTTGEGLQHRPVHLNLACVCLCCVGVCVCGSDELLRTLQSNIVQRTVSSPPSQETNSKGRVQSYTWDEKQLNERLQRSGLACCKNSSIDLNWEAASHEMVNLLFVHLNFRHSKGSAKSTANILFCSLQICLPYLASGYSFLQWNTSACESESETHWNCTSNQGYLVNCQPEKVIRVEVLRMKTVPSFNIVDKWQKEKIIWAVFFCFFFCFFLPFCPQWENRTYKMSKLGCQGFVTEQDPVRGHTVLVDRTVLLSGSGLGGVRRSSTLTQLDW